MTPLFGLKLWSRNTNLLEEASQLVKDRVFQYIELMPIPDTDMARFASYNLPYIIHITSEDFNFNIADPKKWRTNQDIFLKNIDWADTLHAQYLILHPGFGEMDNALEFLNSTTDTRIIIENMPKIGIHGEKMIGYSPAHLKKLMGKKFGFCLDMNHAIKASISLGVSYKQYIQGLMELTPVMYHISDGNLNIEHDEHLHINEGTYDFEFLISCVKKNKCIRMTLETPRTSVADDVRNVKRLQSYFH